MSRLLCKTINLSNFYLKSHIFGKNCASLYHSDKGVYGHKPNLQDRSTFSAKIPENVVENGNLYRLVSAYREHGHEKAAVDPLNLTQTSAPAELDPQMYGLQEGEYDTSGILLSDSHRATLSDIVDRLEGYYCGPMTAEFMYLQSPEERYWFTERYEQLMSESLHDNEKVDAAKLMLKSQAFDHFLANKFPAVKRYGGEGAESMLSFIDELFKISAKTGVKDVIFCHAHRGRLNLLTCLAKYKPVDMFMKMKGKREFPSGVVGSGDVLSHLTSSVDLNYGEDSVHITMVPNPSHLEAVNPVAVGKTRARQQTHGIGQYAPPGVDGKEGDGVLCFQIHGDAAFAAQGIVPETFALANIPHYTVGGSIHLIINNQLGFTTPTIRGKSSQYASCIGKTNACPVIRVNADYPEEVIKACRLAMEYREKFRKDVIVDLMCFRKYGHNEVDEPAFTNPVMYNVIRSRESIPDLYAKKITSEGLCTEEELATVVSDWKAVLEEDLKRVDSHVPKANHLEKHWSGLVQPSSSITKWDTGVPVELLKYAGAKSVTVPDDMAVHETLKKTHIQRRLGKVESGKDIDWATAEAMALGSLLYQGFNIRISGQDVGRGTFSHRHAMLVDQETGDMFIPLNHISDDQKGYFEVCNSLLSEEAVLGFEYGVSIESPNTLAIWEAQFGDFFNGAQIIVDTFVTGGETKWLLQSGLVVLLPHGMDGTGPEHSSAKIERFLQLSDSAEDGVDGDDVNVQIVYPTTPAQYFHLLRRQMIRNFRKPLVVIAPKLLLRQADAVSNLSEMTPGTTFQPVLGDPTVNPKQVQKVVFTSGKQYYTLKNERDKRGVKDMAIIRLESLCPFPTEEIRQELTKYSNAEDFIWSQEEHRNQGAWFFVSPRFENVVGRKLRYVGRCVHATPAAGVGEVHKAEAQEIMDQTFS